MNFSRSFKIEQRKLGSNCGIYIIAEAGVAHFGSEEKALQLVDLAVNAGADAVKFQVFDIEALFASEMTEWRTRLGSRQLSHDAFIRVQAYCRTKGITFFATAHDEPSLEFLVSLDVPAYKVGSGEVGNWSYIRKVASLGKPILFSTGMYRQEQIAKALEAVASTGNPDVAVLHCVTQYPTLPVDVSLGNLAVIRDNYKVITGYSDHTAGYHIPLAAAALGAQIIEKHITLDFDVPNAQDWKVSCGPENFHLFVQHVHEIELSLSKRLTGPTQGEKKSLNWAGKSLVASHDIPAGRKIREEDLTFKRAGTGIPPYRINEVVGKLAKTRISKDKAIEWEQLQ